MIKSKYKFGVFVGIYCTIVNFITEVFLVPGNSSSKYHLLGIAGISIFGGIIGGIISGTVVEQFNKWYKNGKRKESAAK
jgi:fructose-specific phosphotransferase system IIC component